MLSPMVPDLVDTLLKEYGCKVSRSLGYESRSMKMESLRKSRFHVSKKELSVEIAPRVSAILTTLDVLS